MIFVNLEGRLYLYKGKDKCNELRVDHICVSIIESDITGTRNCGVRLFYNNQKADRELIRESFDA